MVDFLKNTKESIIFAEVIIVGVTIMLSKELKEVLKVITSLSAKDKEWLAKKLSQETYQSNTKANNKVEENKEFINQRFASGVCCPLCGGNHIVRNGHRYDGTQRYVCKECNKSFVITTNSTFENSHKSISVWKKYIECMINKFSIRKTAEICEIATRTSFLWRHKILDTLQGMSEDVYLSGIAEADETFFPISYKGNHKKSLKFVMPRDPHKRGKDHEYTYIKRENGTYKKEKINNKRGLSKGLVCVPCAVNRMGYSIAKVSNLGKISTKALIRVYGDRIKEDTVLCTDKEKAYRVFAKEREIELIQLRDHQNKRGIYNIQTINSYHSRLKKFIEIFNGVSTKYLNNYLIWHNIINFSRGTEIDKQKDILAYLMMKQFHERNKQVTDKPNLPLLV